MGSTISCDDHLGIPAAATVPGMRSARIVAAVLCIVAIGPSVGAPAASAARDPWRALLARVPASGTFADSMIINDYAAARAAADVKRSSDRVHDLFRLEQATGIAPSELLRSNGPGDPLADELGIRARDVERDVAAGDPPEDLTILEGSIDAGKVEAAVEADDNFSDLLETARHAGERYYTWGSGRVDPRRRTPLRPLGIGGNLAVDPPYATWSDTAASVEASIDAVAGDAPSLADDRDLMAVADALQHQDAYAAFLSVSEVAPGAATGGPTPLAPYEAIATGPSLAGKGRHEIVIALAYADATTAKAQADRLQTIAEDGTSVSGAPWSELVTIDDIAVDGRLVVGRFRTEKPRLWIDLVFRRDSLVATA
jgi:hypothetical protein